MKAQQSNLHEDDKGCKGGPLDGRKVQWKETATGRKVVPNPNTAADLAFCLFASVCGVCL